MKEVFIFVTSTCKCNIEKRGSDGHTHTHTHTHTESYKDGNPRNKRQQTHKRELFLKCPENLFPLAQRYSPLPSGRLFFHWPRYLHKESSPSHVCVYRSQRLSQQMTSTIEESLLTNLSPSFHIIVPLPSMVPFSHCPV